MKKPLGLADTLELLRDELATAQHLGQNHQFRFEVTEAEIELLVELNSERSVTGKGSLSVVSIGADGRSSRADTHRLRLLLKITDAATGGRNLEVRRNDNKPWRTDEA